MQDRIWPQCCEAKVTAHVSKPSQWNQPPPTSISSLFHLCPPSSLPFSSSPSILLALFFLHGFLLIDSPSAVTPHLSLSVHHYLDSSICTQPHQSHTHSHMQTQFITVSLSSLARSLMLSLPVCSPSISSSLSSLTASCFMKQYQADPHFQRLTRKAHCFSQIFSASLYNNHTVINKLISNNVAASQLNKKNINPEYLT